MRVLVCSKKLISGQEEEAAAATAAAAAEASAVAWLSFRSRGSRQSVYWCQTRRTNLAAREISLRFARSVSFVRFFSFRRSVARWPPPHPSISLFCFATEIVKISIWKLGNDNNKNKKKRKTKRKINKTRNKVKYKRKRAKVKAKQKEILQTEEKVQKVCLLYICVCVIPDRRWIVWK